MADDGSTRSADWLQPPAEQEGLKRYVQTIRERLWLVALAVIVATGAAALYVATAEQVYEAEADMLVSPVPDEAELVIGLGLLRESADPLRSVETAARLITNVGVAAIARQKVGPGESAEALLDKVRAEPVAESDIVAITAEGPAPEAAADLANAFARAAIAQRTQELHRQIDRELPELEARLADDRDPALAREIARLEILRSSQDPTLQLEARATPPDSAVSPKPALSIVGGLLAGLVLGIGGAFAFQVLDPRLRREEQLRSSYRLPILARIPREASGREEGPLPPERLSPDGIEAYRTLRATLGASQPGGSGPRAALITSPSASEGKTTTALNLAASLALAGREVILIEADLRRPEIGSALGIGSPRGVVSVLIEEASLADSLVTSHAYGPNLKLLLAEQAGAWVAELFTLPAGPRLIEEAKSVADHVVIDSPPVTAVVDALPLARAVDDIVLVVRLSRSRLDRIGELAELLAENGIRPAGFAVLGVPRVAGRDYYTYRRELAEEHPVPPASEHALP